MGRHVKIEETKAVHQLSLALDHLKLAEESLTKAWADCDDFPTARHELDDVKQKVAKLVKGNEDALENLNRIKTK